MAPLPARREASLPILEDDGTFRRWTVFDKSKWPPGPWHEEPDKQHWVDAATGYDCLVQRNHTGALCGYVGVGAEHVLQGVDYSDLDELIEVHGDLTYSGRWIVPGARDEIWWLGFDCGHAGDLWPHPAYNQLPSTQAPFAAYRDLPYVQAQCEHLAMQISKVRR